jgi:hypothetical protein
MKDLVWFVRESKSFMGYGKAISKVKFWTRLPLAYVRFMYYGGK